VEIFGGFCGFFGFWVILRYFGVFSRYFGVFWVFSAFCVVFGVGIIRVFGGF